MKSKEDNKPQAGGMAWYTAPNLDWREAVAIGAVVCALFLAVSYSAVGAWLDDRIARPVAFRVRHWLGRDARLDPRLKVYALGDSALEYLQSDDLTLEDWGKVIELLAPQKPRAVIIAKIFGTPRGIERAKEFTQKLQSMPFPVAAAGFLAESPIRNRPLLPDSMTYLRIQEHLPEDRKESVEAVNELDWMVAQNGYPYGPHPKVRDAFAAIGHGHYDGTLRSQAIIRLGRHLVLPHIGLTAARNLVLDKTGIRADGVKVPIARDGTFLINYLYPTTLADKTYTLSSLIKRIREGKQAAELEPDSVVLILPTMYSGSLDRAYTPWGEMSGGNRLAAVVNSVLTGEWISDARWGWLAIVLAAFAGPLLAWRLESLRFVVGMAVGVVGIVATGLWYFAFVRTELPWLCATLALTAAAVGASTLRTIRAAGKTRRLREVLSGSISEKSIETILRKPENLQIEPTGRVLTIMFIDIVGFSVAAERQTPQQAFLHLKRIMSDLSDTVHSFGGVVDRTMGDGMLCFFGHTYDGSPPPANHADQAIACALKIQRDAVTRCLAASKAGEPVYPLRVGINTAAVYVGDIGSARKIDMTLIGHGVNYAKRLESACDMFCVMIGATTRDMLLNMETLGIDLKKRFIQIKHYSELLEAYECDPFAKEPDKRNEAIDAHRNFSRTDRKEMRWPVPESVLVKTSGTWGDGTLMNFSESGFAIRSNRYLARAVSMGLELDTPDGALRAKLTGMGLLPVIAEVRWGRPIGDDVFMLGVQIKNLSAEQKRVLLQELRNVVSGGVVNTGEGDPPLKLVKLS